MGTYLGERGHRNDNVDFFPSLEQPTIWCG